MYKSRLDHELDINSTSEITKYMNKRSIVTIHIGRPRRRKEREEKNTFLVE